MKESIQNRQSKFDFLVIGAGRGGTSLLAGLLDAHSLLDLGFEKFSYDYLMAQNMDGQDSHLENRIQLFMDYCNQMASESKHIWGNKITSEQVCALAETKEEHWLEAFIDKVVDQKKLIFILRDGRTCVNSKMKRTGQSFEQALHRWKASIGLWKHLQKHLSSSMLTIRFEELVKNPEKELKLACAFLNINYEEKMLKGTGNTKMRKEYQKPGFDLSPIHIDSGMKLWTESMLPELEWAGYKS